MTLAGIFAAVAARVGAVTGAPFHDAEVWSSGAPEFDDGGDVIPYTGRPTQRACRVQFSACTEAMRAADGYTARDMRAIILADGFTGEIGTDDLLRVASGEYAGDWLIQSVSRDTAGVAWDMRVRRG